MYQDVCLVCSEVVDLLDLDLALFLCFEDRLDQDMSRLAERDLGNRKSVLVDLFDSCTYLYNASSLAFHVLGAICESTGREVRVDLEIFALEY